MIRSKRAFVPPLRILPERNPNVKCKRESEILTQHADYCIGLAVDEQGLSDDIRTGSKTISPKRIVKKNGGSRPGLLILSRGEPPESRSCAECAEQRSRNPPPDMAFRKGVHLNSYTRRGDGSDGVNRTKTLLDHFEISGWRPSRLGVRSPEGGRDHHESAGVGIGRGTENSCAQEAEYRGVGADSSG